MHRRGQDADFEIGKCKVAVQRTNQGTPAQSIFAIETAPRRGIVKESRACNARREEEEEKFTIGIALSDAINQTWQFSSNCGLVVADFEEERYRWNIFYVTRTCKFLSKRHERIYLSLRKSRLRTNFNMEKI